MSIYYDNHIEVHIMLKKNVKHFAHYGLKTK
jgi:hypothetical protein